MSVETVNNPLDLYLLEEKLPALRSFRFEIEEYENGFHQGDPFQISEANMPRGGLLICRHKFCHGGGVLLEEIVREMLKDKVRNRALSKKCGGELTSLKGRRSHGKCHRTFEIKVHLDLKSTRPPGRVLPPSI